MSSPPSSMNNYETLSDVISQMLIQAKSPVERNAVLMYVYRAGVFNAHFLYLYLKINNVKKDRDRPLT